MSTIQNLDNVNAPQQVTPVGSKTSTTVSLDLKEQVTAQNSPLALKLVLQEAMQEVLKNINQAFSQLEQALAAFPEDVRQTIKQNMVSRLYPQDKPVLESGLQPSLTGTRSFIDDLSRIVKNIDITLNSLKSLPQSMQQWFTQQESSDITRTLLPLLYQLSIKETKSLSQADRPSANLAESDLLEANIESSKPQINEELPTSQNNMAAKTADKIKEGLIKSDLWPQLIRLVNDQEQSNGGVAPSRFGKALAEDGEEPKQTPQLAENVKIPLKPLVEEQQASASKLPDASRKNPSINIPEPDGEVLKMPPTSPRRDQANAPNSQAEVELFDQNPKQPLKAFSSEPLLEKRSQFALGQNQDEVNQEVIQQSNQSRVQPATRDVGVVLDRFVEKMSNRLEQFQVLYQQLPEEQQVLVKERLNEGEKIFPESLRQFLQPQERAELKQALILERWAEAANWQQKSDGVLKELKSTLQETIKLFQRPGGAAESYQPQGPEGSKVLTFTMPLMLDPQHPPYPAYVHVYQYEKPKNHLEDSPNQSSSDLTGWTEMWLRLCLQTDHLGMVDLLFYLKDQQVDIRIRFPEPNAAADFRQFSQEIRTGLSQAELTLNDLVIFS